MANICFFILEVGFFLQPLLNSPVISRPSLDWHICAPSLYGGHLKLRKTQFYVFLIFNFLLSSRKWAVFPMILNILMAFFNVFIF